MIRIKRILAELLSWVYSIIYLLYWLFVHCIKSDFKNHIRRKCQGRTIDIIVNGPSFASQIDVVKKDGNDKCMVNCAANSPLFWELKPTYYCVSDPHVFMNVDNNKEYKKLIENIKKVDWDLTFFVTYYDYKHHIRCTDIDKLENVHFTPFHSTEIPFSFKFKKIAFGLFKKGQAMPIPMSVSIPAIMTSINSGYNDINLYGFDNDWIHNVVINENNQVCLRDTHFYNDQVELTPWMKNDSETFTMYEILQTQTELFESYWFIKEYIEYLGDVRIINRSPVSLIDAFDRK